MVKYLIAVLIGIFGALLLIYLFIGVPRVYPESLPELKTPHLYNLPKEPIAEVKIAAFYFVPKNRTDFLFEDWQKIFEENIRKIQDFHHLQFQGKSLISYEIFPEPIIGYEDNQFYDTDITQFGNPEALKSIAIELENRVFGPSGDLYQQDFAKQEGESYRSLLVMYEGVGASGSENVGLVSRTFLTEPEYKEFGTSIFAHEFYHTLRIPDGYEIPSGIPTTQDIMGEGRYRPVEKTYIKQATLQQLGL